MPRNTILGSKRFRDSYESRLEATVRSVHRGYRIGKSVRYWAVGREDIEIALAQEPLKEQNHHRRYHTPELFDCKS